MRSLFLLASLLIVASAPAAAQAPGLGAIIAHTPGWVWMMFLFVGAMTLRATRARTASLQRLLVVPAVFIVWGIASLVNRPHFGLVMGLDWLSAAMLGALLAFGLGGPAVLAVDRERGLVQVAGSWVPLVRVTAICLAKYALGVSMALHPDLRAPLGFADTAVSGFSAGYFLLWGTLLYRATALAAARPLTSPSSP
jgi:hypothetical protein